MPRAHFFRPVDQGGCSRELVAWFHRRFPPPPGPPPERAALFYPSAGRDLMAPLLLGLPYCRLFYFYDREHAMIGPAGLLRALRGGLADPVERAEWRPDPDPPGLERAPRRRRYRSTGDYVVRFHHRGIMREIHWVCRENGEFLMHDVDLAFYFHRGDSEGEGGSGQWWDGELLHLLLAKIPTDGRCLFLTNGQPWGLHPDLVRLARPAADMPADVRDEDQRPRPVRGARPPQRGPSRCRPLGEAPAAGWGREAVEPAGGPIVEQLGNLYTFCLRGDALPALAPLPQRSDWPWRRPDPDYPSLAGPAVAPEPSDPQSPQSMVVPEPVNPRNCRRLATPGPADPRDRRPPRRRRPPPRRLPLE